MRFKSFVISLLVLLVSFGVAFGATDDYAPGDVLVVFKSAPSQVLRGNPALSAGLAKTRAATTATSLGATVKETYDSLSDGEKTYALVHSDMKDAKQLLAELRMRDDVLGASLNRKYKALSVTPNDPKYSDLWGISAVKAPEVWEDTTGDSDVYVAVIDSGVDYNHSDLADNFEKDGYSISYYGGSNNYSDGVGHGTHVAGTIAAVGDNSKGVVGINWNAKIISVRILNNRGECYSDELINAIDYLTKLIKNNPNLNLAAINLSIGGYCDESPEDLVGENDPEYLALTALSDLNKTVICVAAGNEGVEVGTKSRNGYCYPASYKGIDNMIVVAAADNSSSGEYTLASYSNYSKTYVDIAAPGTGIYSTYPGGGFNTLDGTSMATPHVAGAVALLKSAFPDATASEIKSALLIGANHNLFKNSTTSGFMNIKAAYDILNANNNGVATAPTIKTETIDDGKILTSYTAKISASGTSPITWSITSGKLPIGFTFTSHGSYATIEGSTKYDGDYSITVEAKNSAGTASKTFNFKIVKAPVITSTKLPALDRGKDYSAQLEVEGTESKPIWRLVNGSSLPGTLTMTDSGLITGTVYTIGTYTFDVAASSSNGYDIKTITLVCGVIPKIDTSEEVPAGKVGEYYECAFGGKASNATWSIKGTLPKGLTFDSVWHYIYGTPTEAGKFDLTVFLTNNVGEDKRDITIVIESDSNNDPVTPDNPVTPVDPVTPNDPVDPKPNDPVTPDPVNPNPNDPVDPVDPVTPNDPVDPVTPNDPVTPDPVNPNPNDPVDPVTPDEPVEPKPNDPVTPDPVDPKPVDPTPSDDGKKNDVISTVKDIIKRNTGNTENVFEFTDVADLTTSRTVNDLSDSQKALVENDDTTAAVVVKQLTVKNDGVYIFDFTLKSDIPTGSALLWYSFESSSKTYIVGTAAAYDLYGEDVIFLNSNNEEIFDVPSDHIVKVAVKLYANKTYSPVLAARVAKKSDNKNDNAPKPDNSDDNKNHIDPDKVIDTIEDINDALGGGSGGGCNTSGFGIFALLLPMILKLRKSN